jgi:ankyrin repeat protein
MAKEVKKGDLVEAVRAGDRDECSRILESEGADVHEKDENIYSRPSLICIATENGRSDIVDLLLSKGAFVNDKDNIDRSPLYIALCNGHDEVVEILISNGAVLNDKDNNLWSPLQMASYRGHAEVAEMLISNGAIINDKDSDVWSPLRMASYYGRDDIVALLLSEGAKPLIHRNIHGKACFDGAGYKGKITFILRKWRITMVSWCSMS